VSDLALLTLDRDKDKERAGGDSQHSSQTGTTETADAAALALGVTMTDPSSSQSHDGQEPDLPAGTTLGRYEIASKLGSGGMGVVYRANDPDLDRVVAIKVLHDGPDGSRPSELLQQRLMREAKAMAKLSHPNLVTIYDVGSINKHVFIAMELVDGKTLRAWMAEPRHSWRERVRVLIDAGKGLAAAHAAGVIHRDFKPDNVLIGRHVQVVDFGLARNVVDSGEFSGAANRALAGATNLTHTGALIGTPAYMSPEQHRGDPTDERSDQFSFAVTAFHALCGYRPFDGETVAEISTAVLKGELRPVPETAEFPAEVFDVLARALSTNPMERYPSMLAMIAALERAAAPKQVHRRPWLFPSIVTALAALIVIVVIATDPKAPPPRVIDDEKRIVVTPTPPRQLSFRGDVSRVALNPQGRRLAYVSNDRLIIRHIPTGNETTVRQARYFIDMSWSADGTRLVYSAVDESLGNGLFIYGVADKKEKRVRRAASALCLVSDDEIATSALTMKRISVRNMKTKKRRWVDFKGDYVWLRSISCAVSPGRFLVLTRTKTRDQLSTIRFDGTQRQLLIDAPAIHDARWSATGNAIYYLRGGATGGELMKLTVDGKTGRAAGKPQLILAELEGTGKFSVSTDGTMAYVRGRRSSNVWRVKRTKAGVNSEPEQVTRGTAPKLGLAISPDGTQLAYTTRTPDGVRLSVQPADSAASPRAVAKLDTLTEGVTWSHDGKRVAVLVTDKAGVPRLRIVDIATGTVADVKAPLPSGSEQIAWSPKGKLAYQLPGNQNYNLVDPASGEASPLLPKVTGWFFRPTFSPTGDKLAVFWNRSTRGVWIIDMTTRKSTLAAAGEKDPIGWSKDGKWIYVASRATLGGRKIERLELAKGKLEPWLALPARFERLKSVRLNNDGHEFLLNVEEGSSDVWLVRR